MSTLLAVIVGALAAGIPTTGLAFLQRRWAVKDAQIKWRQERHALLFEKRQDAHLAFLDALHTAERILDRQEDGILEAVDVLSHAHSRIQAYASMDALRYGTKAAQALIRRASAAQSDDIDADDILSEEALDARMLYESALRLDLATDAEDPFLREAIRSTLTDETPDGAA
ncbi:MAG: hypothetical protein M3306_21770 [Actinomycetota bacterium]|nr:hypothetical protein [Actinomycetota bacterium]